MELLGQIEEFIKYLPKSNDDDGANLGKKRERSNSKAERKRARKNRSKKGSEKGNEVKRDPQSIKSLSELQMKVREKIESFNVNKGKRSQRKEKRNNQSEKDKHRLNADSSKTVKAPKDIKAKPKERPQSVAPNNNKATQKERPLSTVPHTKHKNDKPNEPKAQFNELNKKKKKTF